MKDVFCDSLQVSGGKYCELALQFPNSSQQHYKNLHEKLASCLRNVCVKSQNAICTSWGGGGGGVSVITLLWKDRGPSQFCERSVNVTTGVADPVRWLCDSL